MVKPYKLELCTDEVNRALRLQDKVDQIEFCSRLDLDGLTPSISEVAILVDKCSVPLKIMIRQLSDNFSVTESELALLIEEAKVFKDLGVNQFVFGALKNGRLDIETIKAFCSSVYPSKVCIHKAVDCSTQLLDDTGLLLDIANVDAILTSGGAMSALEGATMLNLIKNKVGKKIEIIGAGGIKPDNIGLIHEVAKLNYYHGRLIVG